MMNPKTSFTRSGRSPWLARRHFPGPRTTLTQVALQSREPLRRHTRAELRERDPKLYEFIRRLTGTPDPDPALARVADGALRFYEWAGDGIELERAKSLFGPLTPSAAEPK